MFVPCFSAFLDSVPTFVKGDNGMVCEEKEPKIPESTQKTPAKEPEERTPEETREISLNEAKGASSESDDG